MIIAGKTIQNSKDVFPNVLLIHESGWTSVGEMDFVLIISLLNTCLNAINIEIAYYEQGERNVSLSPCCSI